jgi:hypothetical protein
MPPTWPKIQLLGSGFGQYGSTRNAGLCACAVSVDTMSAATMPSARDCLTLIFSPLSVTNRQLKACYPSPYIGEHDPIEHGSNNDHYRKGESLSRVFQPIQS